MKPTPTPPWSVLKTLRKAVLQSNPLKIFEEARDLAGDLYKLNFGLWTLYVISDPDIVEELSKVFNWNIIVKDPVSEESTSPVQQTAGDFNLLSDGYFHKHYRDTLGREFTREKIGSYVEVLFDSYNEMSNCLPSDEPVDLAWNITSLMMSVIFKGMFDIGFSQEENIYIRRTLAKTARLQKSWLFLGSLGTSVFNPEAAGYRRMSRKVRSLLDEKVAEVKQCPFSPNYIRDFMQRETNNKNAAVDIGRKKIIDDMYGMLVAGVETVASTIMWTVRILSERPEIVRRIREEVSGVSNHIGDLHLNYSHLHYTRSVFLETLRLYPVFPVIPRLTIEEMSINDYIIPAKSWLTIPIYTIHRDSRWYPNAQEFDPERWAGNTSVLNTGSRFIPFGFGAHRCAGWELALAEGTIMLALLYSQFHIEPKGPIGNYPVADIPINYTFNVGMKEKVLYYMKRI